MGQTISCLSVDGHSLLTAANDGDCEGVRQVMLYIQLVLLHATQDTGYISVESRCFVAESQILTQNIELAASAAFPKQRNCLHYAAGEPLSILSYGMQHSLGSNSFPNLV